MLFLPIPKDRGVVERIGNAVVESIEELEKSISSSNDAKNFLKATLE